MKKDRSRQEYNLGLVQLYLLSIMLVLFVSLISLLPGISSPAVGKNLTALCNSLLPGINSPVGTISSFLVSIYKKRDCYQDIGLLFFSYSSNIEYKKQCLYKYVSYVNVVLTSTY